jgi:hypothetical protein
MTSSTEWETAVHEAGHAVAAVFNECPIDAIHLLAADSAELGWCALAPDPFLAEQLEVALEYAGPLGDQTASAQWETDRELARHLVLARLFVTVSGPQATLRLESERRTAGVLPDEPSAAWDLPGHESDASQSLLMARWLSETSDDQTDEMEIFGKTNGRAHAWMQHAHVWAAVNAVASRLVECRRLSGDETVSVCRSFRIV